MALGAWEADDGAETRETHGSGDRGQGRHGGESGQRKELGCGLGCGGVACLTAALARVSSGGDLAAARARARSWGNKSKAVVI